ncbi:long-chain-fatty-acid--CoA ligase [Streptomyces ipomoeae]|uniref:long-chain-fatty-acid--CoA ligase n=1 Tax=Streptomyces ipomoeae TaxID=103232 RepID=UPI0011468828|nr:long-chain fatty acid--CoA ligase [Streptomyces ipomoeae]MDX2937732.1 long-chain fatty acid--CoA ligase [Streptomyces ipomoeae]TQE17260.1 long-chain fatty acid--CoA ligase [Streptomyces ipomoeae]
MSSIYDQRPWLSQYDPGQPHDSVREYATALDMFAASVRRAPETPIIRYFDGVLTLGELDAQSDAFACGLLDAGVRGGDRVALYLQNVPQFVIALLGVWKAGAIAVSVSPMYKQRELNELLSDSGASAVVCLESLYVNVRAVFDGIVVSTSELKYQRRNDPRALGGVERIDCPGAQDMSEVITRFTGRRPPAVSLGPDDVAVLTYTSGTTGPPKGAMITHGNVVFNAQTYRNWVGLGPDDVVFGVAPLFHVTGLIAHIGVSLLVGAPLVLFHRFEPSLAIDTVRETGATFTVASITVFIALMNAPNADRTALATLTKVYSGGAPIAPSTVKAFAAQFGPYIHNIYGMTETTSPSHAVPLHAEAPVDEASGALSVGVPVYSTVVRVLDEKGGELPPGKVGELVVTGPQVVSGYWRKPEETAKAIRDGGLRTGDMGYMDADGWFYIVDRKKDQINAGGYKVWPREVEDVLYEHEAVREAAVVGVPHEYRGETVKAFVSLRPGRQVTPEELITFCKTRLAAYKYPREVELLEDLPKTASGKLLRRELG